VAALPVRRNVFDLESLPVRVSFDADATDVRGFHCSGPPLAWSSTSSVFRRIAQA